jgi:DNA transformation protein and related proteins
MIRPASPQDEFVAFVLEQMVCAGPVRARRMFGGYGIYLGELFVAIVLHEKLYLKACDTTRREFESRGLQPLMFKMRNKQIAAQYFEAPPEVFDDPDVMTQWLQLARTAALQATDRKKRRGLAKAQLRDHEA